MLDDKSRLWKTRAHTHASSSRGAHVKRFTKAALGGIAGSALVLAGTQVAGASTTYRYVDKLGDFSPEEGPFDSTTGKVTIVQNDDGTTTFSIKITGIDTSMPVPDDGYGAHLHNGPCVDGDYADSAIGKVAGSLAGPHYNTELAPDGTSSSTRICLGGEDGR